MRAIVMTAFGGPEVFAPTTSEPEPEHGQIRVRLYAAGSILRSLYQNGPVCLFKPTLPYTPGLMRGVVDRWAGGARQ